MGHQSAPAKLNWETNVVVNMDTKEGKGKISWEESEETDNFSLSINGEPTLLEGDSPNIHSEIRLIQCVETSQAENSMLMAGQKISPASKLALSWRNWRMKSGRLMSKESLSLKLRKESHMIPVVALGTSTLCWRWGNQASQQRKYVCRTRKMSN